MTRPISDLDVALPTLRDRMEQLIARQRAAVAAERVRLLVAEHPASRAATAGEAAEFRHLLYDADSDATVPAFPYPTAEETP